MSSPDQPLGCCVAVINSDNKVLLGQRKNGYKAGWYGVPGGRLEVTEKLAGCAARELREEAGIIPETLELVASVCDHQVGYHFVHFGFVCRKWSGEITLVEPEKCEGWEWFAADQLPEQILPGHRAVVEAAFANQGHQIIELYSIDTNK